MKHISMRDEPKHPQLDHLCEAYRHLLRRQPIHGITKSESQAMPLSCLIVPTSTVAHKSQQQNLPSIHPTGEVLKLRGALLPVVLAQHQAHMATSILLHRIAMIGAACRVTMRLHTVSSLRQ